MGVIPTGKVLGKFYMGGIPVGKELGKFYIAPRLALWGLKNSSEGLRAVFHRFG